MKSKQLYCEICGAPAESLVRVKVEEVELNACPSCASKLGPKAILPPPQRQKAPEKPKQKPKPRLESYDITEDYAERIKRARQERGWSEAVLAQRLRVSVDLVRKIEAGKLKPTISLAKSIEEILKVKLLVPTEESDEEFSRVPGKVTLGDIVVVRKKGEE
ncbi:MAG: multiprotein bridging factor aMBF1 [Acidilobaceae archaeon]|nr:multiprotein bridging factor aMBF1 [Acidilobaceae archaeon]